MIVIDLSKQEMPKADLKAIEQINFTGNLNIDEVHQRFSLFKKQKKPS